MKTIRWFGPALVAAAVAATLVANAAPGDPVWVQRSASIALDTTQRNNLATWVGTVWPAAQPAGIRELHCLRPPLRCRIVDERTATASTYVVHEAEGKAVAFVSAAGGNITYRYTDGYVALGNSQTTGLAAWVTSVWGSIPADDVVGLQVLRVSGTPDTFPAFLEHLEVGTPSEYATARSAGTVIRRAGTVE
jgi:hypothetical protein